MNAQQPMILQQLQGKVMQSPLARLLPQIKQVKQILGSVQNPNVMLNQILQQNPQVNQIISQYGSVDGAINALCQQQGISVQEFYDALK